MFQEIPSDEIAEQMHLVTTSPSMSTRVAAWKVIQESGALVLEAGLGTIVAYLCDADDEHWFIHLFNHPEQEELGPIGFTTTGKHYTSTLMTRVGFGGEDRQMYLFQVALKLNSVFSFLVQDSRTPMPLKEKLAHDLHLIGLLRVDFPRK